MPCLGGLFSFLNVPCLAYYGPEMKSRHETNLTAPTPECQHPGCFVGRWPHFTVRVVPQGGASYPVVSGVITYPHKVGLKSPQANPFIKDIKAIYRWGLNPCPSTFFSGSWSPPWGKLERVRFFFCTVDLLDVAEAVKQPEIVLLGLRKPFWGFRKPTKNQWLICLPGSM